jgi:hypothetical protein
VARELPAQFHVAGVVVRDQAKRDTVRERFGVATHRSLDDLLRAEDLRFVLAAVPWAVTPVIVCDLAERGVPVLAETPPAPDLESLNALVQRVGPAAKIQVAEQYLFQPLNAARAAVAASGVLGTVRLAEVSLAHGYHGMSLLRRLLGLSFEDATITAREFTAPIVVGPGREGPPTEEKLVSSTQVIAQLDFGDRLGVYDFTGDQYFSWIRSPRLLVRGDRGEINNAEVRYLADYQTPVVFTFQRQDAGQDGNLEGYYHKGILGGSSWLYRNPLAPGRLSDDEIAVGTCLLHMDRYVSGGPSFYSLPEAAQDHYLGLMIEAALRRGSPVTTTPQSWAR